MERRGHRFARYADDLIILVKSPRAGERVMRSITRYLETTLALTVNPAKSKVASGQDYYEECYRERVLRALSQRAAKLGMQMVPIAQPA